MALLNGLRNELLGNRSYGLGARIAVPLVRVLAGSNMQTGPLKLEVNGELVTVQKSVRASILAVLLDSPKQAIDAEELIPLTNEGTSEALKQQLKNLHSDIQKKWLKIPRGTQNHEAKKVLENRGGFWTLNVEVLK